MAGKLERIEPDRMADNVFSLLDHDWMLITAGNPKSFNTMTASWGGFGILWGKRIAVCFVRPVRYTYEFIEREPVFTLSAYAEDYRDALNVCGNMSGRDGDKVKKAGLTPAAAANGSVYFSEARLVLECRKIYTHDLDPKRFLDPAIDGNYPKKDYHRMYVGEITACLRRA